jgi:hypothetical protein
MLVSSLTEHVNHQHQCLFRAKKGHARGSQLAPCSYDVLGIVVTFTLVDRSTVVSFCNAMNRLVETVQSHVDLFLNKD